jgi:hypothetical protein
MPVNGTMVDAGVACKFAETKRFNAVRFETRKRGFDERVRQTPVAKGLSRSLPSRDLTHRSPA